MVGGGSRAIWTMSKTKQIFFMDDFPKQVEQVWGQEKQEVQRLPDLPEKEKTSLEKTLPYLAAAGVLAGGEEEVVQRFREVVVPARTITNGLVLDLMQLSQVHILEK